MALPSVNNLYPILTFVGGAVAWHLTGEIVGDIWTGVKKSSPKILSSGTNTEIADDELKTEVQMLSKHLARKIHNGQNYPVTPDEENPYQTAKRQKEYVQEQLDRFKEQTIPHSDYSFEEIREAARARGIWVNEIDELYQNPNDFGDLREALILLENIEAQIPSLAE